MRRGQRPRIDLELQACSVVWRALDLAHHAKAGIVHDDVEATEDVICALERVENVLRLCDVQLEDEQLFGRVLSGEVGERFWLAACRDGDVATM